MRQGNFAGCVVPSGSRWMQSLSSAISSTGRFQVSPGRPVIWFNPLLDCDVDKKDCWYMRQISAQIHTRYMVFSSHLFANRAGTICCSNHFCRSTFLVAFCDAAIHAQPTYASKQFEKNHSVSDRLKLLSSHLGRGYDVFDVFETRRGQLGEGGSHIRKIERERGEGRPIRGGVCVCLTHE